MRINKQKLIQLIECNGYSTRSFSEHLGYDPAYCRNVIKKGTLSPRTAKMFADALGCSIEDFWEEERGRVKVVLDPGAKMPTRAHEHDAGYDLYSREDRYIWPRSSEEFDTGVHIAIPAGYVGDVKSKSGLMMNYNIITDGTVDSGYTGSIRVKLFNLGLGECMIEKGQKIAQLVIKKIDTPKLLQVDKLSETARGNGGFGSSGKF